MEKVVYTNLHIYGVFTRKQFFILAKLEDIIILILKLLRKERLDYIGKRLAGLGISAVSTLVGGGLLRGSFLGFEASFLLQRCHTLTPSLTQETFGSFGHISVVC